MAASDESFKRPGTVPFKWEVQPGIPKEHPAGDVVPSATTSPRLALPPAARVVPAGLLSPTAPAPQTPSHRRSMSARFATSLALVPLPFTRRGRGGGGGGRAGAVKDADFCLLYAENKVA